MFLLPNSLPPSLVPGSGGRTASTQAGARAAGRVEMQFSGSQGVQVPFRHVVLALPPA